MTLTLQEIDVVFEPEVRWKVPLRSSAPARRRGTFCLLPWICLALANNRARRRARSRRF